MLQPLTLHVLLVYRDVVKVTRTLTSYQTRQRKTWTKPFLKLIMTVLRKLFAKRFWRNAFIGNLFLMKESSRKFGDWLAG